MNISKQHYPVLIVNILALLIFSTIFFLQGNVEFVLYVLIILLFGGLIIASMKHVQWPPSVLWGLTLWAILHMMGGGIRIDGHVLYAHMLLPLIGEPYLILKYDQVVHTLGFFVATLVVWVLLKPYLTKKHGRIAIPLIVIMAGLGLGALNEIVEFAVTVLVPETNVGGYENTAIDLVTDLLGAILAWMYISWSNNRKQQ